jgi:hypothetical protein
LPDKDPIVLYKQITKFIYILLAPLVIYGAIKAASGSGKI